LAERARQQALEGEDAQEAVRKASFWSFKGDVGGGGGLS
jgi:hypothetical protein